MNYEQGLEALQAAVEQTNRQVEFVTLEARLLESLQDERLYGPDEASRSGRARIVGELNRLALEVMGQSFNDLAMGRVGRAGGVSARDLSLIRQLGIIPGAGPVEPPVQARLQALPFNELSWEQFEALCAALIEARPSTLDCHLYGLPGDDQQGIDIVARQRGVHGDEVWAYQCKRYKDYSPGQLRQAMDKMTHPADFYVLVLSIPASAALRQVVEERQRVFLWDAKDLARKLKYFPILIKDFFGPAWRAAFCAGRPAE